ncbi:MAG: ATP-binding protein [Rhodoferax sp.]
MITARSFGNYDLAAALADLIDNSIRAQASHISISFSPEGDDVIVRIRDNGCGMNKEELIKAMRPASSNPEDVRDAEDLGRFGWGLKSASLSQARVLTVVTWGKTGCTSAKWDIDNLDDWTMEIEDGNKALKSLKVQPNTSTGTEIIWSNCDRLLDAGKSVNIDEQLNEKISFAQRQLSLIFHRYLSGEAWGKFNIEVQGLLLKVIDPFMRQHPATQTIDEEIIQLRGKEKISVKPYTIPHFSKLSIQEKEALGGDEGLVRNQGFYVYRNKRLIIYGTWFRLVPHGELSQLTRVQVDLPNTQDKDWKITLDKSDAQLPPILRLRLRDYIKNFSQRSVKANRRRGVDLTVSKNEPVWRRNAYNGRIRYLINRDHPLVRQMLCETDNHGIAREALNLIESCLPTEMLADDHSKNKLEQVQSIIDPDAFNALIDAFFLVCVAQSEDHPTLREVIEFTKNTEPFSSQWKYTESYIRNTLKTKWKMK